MKKYLRSKARYRKEESAWKDVKRNTGLSDSDKIQTAHTDGDWIFVCRAAIKAPRHAPGFLGNPSIGNSSMPYQDDRPLMAYQITELKSKAEKSDNLKDELERIKDEKREEKRDYEDKIWKLENTLRHAEERLRDEQEKKGLVKQISEVAQNPNTLAGIVTAISSLKPNPSGSLTGPNFTGCKAEVYEELKIMSEVDCETLLNLMEAMQNPNFNNKLRSFITQNLTPITEENGTGTN